MEKKTQATNLGQPHGVCPWGYPNYINGDTEKNMGFWGTVKHFQTKPYSPNGGCDLEEKLIKMTLRFH